MFIQVKTTHVRQCIVPGHIKSGRNIASKQKCPFLLHVFLGGEQCAARQVCMQLMTRPALVGFARSDLICFHQIEIK